MCTNLSIPTVGAKKPHRVSARTMDFGVPFKSELKKYAVGESFPCGPHAIVHPLKWTSKYGFIGIQMEVPLHGLDITIPSIFDGMNSAGLSIAALWLPGSQYPKATGTKNNRMWMTDFPYWVLGNFIKVSEVDQALERGDIQIEGLPIIQDKTPLHFVIEDGDGQSLIVEFEAGQVTRTRSKNGIMTNAPFYHEQLENLGQPRYEALRPENTEQQYGQETNGSGMVGVPGDATPPSRFVRASKMHLSTYRPKPESDQDSVSFAWQLLQAVWVPYGTITKMNEPQQLADYTLWAVLRDYTKKHYYFYSAFNPTLRKIDLNQLDFNTPSNVKLPIEWPDGWCVDETGRLEVANLEAKESPMPVG